MKKLLNLLFGIFFILTNIQSQTSLMSFNIRLDVESDNENRWEYRKSELVCLIKKYNPAILGIQEGLNHQVAYIDSVLDSYAYVGIGRDGENTVSEAVNIFYDSTKFVLLGTETFWLSETPEKVSIGWDAALNRIATYGFFYSKETNDTLHVFNTHFDHMGVLARKKSVRVILNKLEYLNPEKQKVVVMGDMNCLPNDQPIQLLKTKFSDAVDISEKKIKEPFGTFNGFNASIKNPKRIDYIFVRNLKVKSCQIINDKRKNGFYLSDHYPVFVELNF